MGVCESNEYEIREILFVINESNRAYYRAIIPQEYFKDPVLTLDEIKEQMKKMTFYTNRMKGKIVGVAALEEKGEGLGQIHWVYVLPDYQRRGIGTTLIRHIESEVIKRNFQKLTIITSEKADWARKFYVKLNYELVETRNTPEGGEAIFIKTLSSGHPS